MRLVAHVASRFRNRGVAYSDLLQDGFCGLLEAIDRFEPSHENKLATYAVWWIRQAVQKSVAEGAYPVRLSPRSLRQLARNQVEVSWRGPKEKLETDAKRIPEIIAETIQRVHAATRPTISLDAGLRADSEFNLLDAMSDRVADSTDAVDGKELIAKLICDLKPRERQILRAALRARRSGQAVVERGRQIALDLERASPPDPGSGIVPAPRARRRNSVGGSLRPRTLIREESSPATSSSLPS